MGAGSEEGAAELAEDVAERDAQVAQPMEGCVGMPVCPQLHRYNTPLPIKVILIEEDFLKRT